MSWTRLRIAVVAGDEREQEVARLAAVSGASVSGFGFPWPAEGIEGVVRAPDLGTALDGADYALFPIPGIADDGSLFAPDHPEPITPSEDALARMAPGAAIALGAASDALAADAQRLGIELMEYESDRALMLERTPAIVEGALLRMIEATDETLHDSDIVVVGFGTIGSRLAQALRLLGARVTVAARNPEQLAAAFADGLTPMALGQLPDRAEEFGILVSSVPVRVVGEDVLSRLPHDSLVMDLAAPPGGVDLDAARAIGHRAIWARGLGGRAPRTVGSSQWAGVARRILERERARKRPDASA